MKKNILFLPITLLFIFCIMCMLQNYINKNKNKINHIETFIQHEKEIQTNLKDEKGKYTFFNNKEFKPDCCPSTYTTDRGCACMSDKDKKFLQERGNNHSGTDKDAQNNGVYLEI